MKKNNFTYITLTDDNYIVGTEVLIRSLKKVKTKFSLIIMYIDLKEENKKILKSYENVILKKIKKIKNPFFEEGKTIPYLKYVYSKLNCFDFDNYKKMIFLDSDIVVLKNVNNLFKINGKYIGCQDEFLKIRENLNVFYSGFFIYEPSKKTFKDMLEKIKITKSFDNGDMGFLNEYFKNDFKSINKNYHRVKELIYYKRDFNVKKISLLHYTGIKP